MLEGEGDDLLPPRNRPDTKPQLATTCVVRRPNNNERQMQTLSLPESHGPSLVSVPCSEGHDQGN